MTTSHTHRVAVPPLQLEMPRREAQPLGRTLLLVDIVAGLAAVLVVLGLQGMVGPRWLDISPPLLAVGMVLTLPVGLAAGGLYQRRKCAITSVEISRVGRVVATGGLALLGLLQWGDSSSPYTSTAAVAAMTFLAVCLGRGGFRHWLKAERLHGRYLTPVALVGDRGAVSLFAVRLLANTDAGFRPVVHVDVDDTPVVDLTSTARTLPRVGHIDDDLDLVVDQGVRSAVLLTDHLPSDELNRLVRQMERRFTHVQVVTTLAGVAHSRLVPTPLMGETTFYLEPFQAAPWQRLAKRTVDVVGSALLLLLFSPLLLLAAIAVKFTDGGPVLYAQERVGQHGQRILVHKFRSMVVDADALLSTLQDDNERGGPLFKARRDPRITPVGRIMRAASVDELPQLWSILQGDMSLVGPRPALPSEVADFDPVHRRRHEVKPGLTGLWQVEDRDHPDFERYRRHDVFYVENWSLSLDAAILLQTAASVTLRALRTLVGQGDGDAIE